ANAGSDKTITLPSNSVTLNGIGTDADGTIVSYLWTKISGPATFSIGTQSQANTVVNNLVEGVYLFTLRVTDNSGMTSLDTVKVTVNPDMNNLINARVVSRLYPNPATTYINVVIDGKNISNKSFISIYNTNGLIVYQHRLERTQTTTVKYINLSRFPKGAYVLKITYSQSNSEILKFMLQ
ncbi:MAG: T9SS type A sorting domain-containing protein, partial [Lacibacter sp.]